MKAHTIVLSSPDQRALLEGGNKEHEWKSSAAFLHPVLKASRAPACDSFTLFEAARTDPRPVPHS